MNKNILFLFGVFMLFGLFIIGCKTDSATDLVTPATSDVQALKEIVINADSIADFSASDEETIDDVDIQTQEYGGLLKVSSVPISPVRWGRHIFRNQIVRDYNVVLAGDSLATVTITKTIPGELRIGIRLTDTVRVDSVIRKPFTEVVKRKVLFKRIGRSENPRHNWIPIAVTLVKGKTSPDSTNHFSIASLEISGRLDTTITDPLETWLAMLWKRGGIPRQFIGDSIKVRVTIYSANDSSEIVMLRHSVAGSNPVHGRWPMTLKSTTGTSGNYVRVYEQTFVSRLPMARLAARFNMVVDAFSFDSIHNDSAPVQNEFWGMPYISIRR